MDILILILISALHKSAVCISTHHVRAVSPHDYYRNAPLPPDKTNWEVGLKEATYQALLREQIPDAHLKEDIYASSIEGYQDSATPFGDIAVIARGQLYSNSHGYQFIQDPYQNDCDDCHTAHRCDQRQCEPQTSQNIDNLLALWTVKRIRHRDSKFGHRYELQYTISPMNPAANAHFVTRNGRFDYSIPGHVFIVKLKEDGAETRLENSRSNYRFDKEHRSTNHKELKTPWIHHNHRQVGYNDEESVRHKVETQNHYHNTPNSILLNTGEYYLPHKPKPTLAEQGFNPGFLIGLSPHEYKHLINGLPSKGSYDDTNKHFTPSQADPTEPFKHYHHHFYIPEVEDIDYDHKLVRPTVPTASTKQPHPFVTGFRPTIPHKFILTTQQNGDGTTPKQVYTPETTQVVPPLTSYSTLKYPETTVPIAVGPTMFTEPNYVENSAYPRTTLLKVFTVPTTYPTQPTPFSPSPFYVQYSDPDPTYNNNQPPTVPTFITQTIQSTMQPTDTTFYTMHDDTRQQKTQTLVGIFEEITSTQATTPTSVFTTKRVNYHNSINSQLPPPEKGTDTTVPYVASTAVTILSTQSSEDDDENDAESSDRKSTTIDDDSIQTTTALSVNENTESKATIESILTTKFEAASTAIPTVSDDTTTLTASTDNLITTTLATTLEKENRKDFSEDIFGTVSIPRKSKPKVVNTDEFDIFGGTKKPADKTTVNFKPSETVTSKRPNAYDEIFGKFNSGTEKTKLLTPHTSLTVSPESASRNARISKYLKYKRNKSERLSKFRPNKDTEKVSGHTETNGTDVGNDIETKTSQSLITSISFKVNKNKYGGTMSSTQASNVKTLDEEMKDVIKEDMIEMNKNETDFKVNLPQSIKTTTDRSQTFDDVAQSLVNHARVAHFLNGKTTKRTYRPSLR